MYFVIQCADAPDSFEKRRSTRPAHLQHLETLNQQNRLLIAGPLYQQESEQLDPFHITGSLIIAEFPNIEAAKAWAAADPYATAEVFARITVTPFNKVYPQ
jgi:uncharacterized protein YciI